MPSPSAAEFSITRYDMAGQLPHSVWTALEGNPIDANVILPLARKELALEKDPQSSSHHRSNQLWIVCTSNNDRAVDLILSCTAHEMGNYPIFIITARPLSQWSPESLKMRVSQLARRLHESVPVDRVYSVFAPTLISELFSQQWYQLSGITTIDEPYYQAKLWCCVTVDQSSPDSNLRLAVPADTRAVARLCLGFSRQSAPFVLDKANAFNEAQLLISRQQVWVYAVPRDGAEPQIACIVAFTRNTDKMATITKVYTDPAWRRRGCAQRLVRRVCTHLLQTRRAVVLYVADNNHSAAHVYRSVGFTGPNDFTAVVGGVHCADWMEIGFDTDEVELGHW